MIAFVSLWLLMAATPLLAKSIHYAGKFTFLFIQLLRPSRVAEPVWKVGGGGVSRKGGGGSNILEESSHYR